MHSGRAPSHKTGRGRSRRSGAFEDLVRAVFTPHLGDGDRALAISIQLWAALHGFVTLRQAMPLFDSPDAGELPRDPLALALRLSDSPT